MYFPLVDHFILSPLREASGVPAPPPMLLGVVFPPPSYLSSRSQSNLFYFSPRFAIIIASGGLYAASIPPLLQAIVQQ